MIKSSVVIGKNIVAVCINREGQLLGFFIPVPKHATPQDIHPIVYDSFNKIIDTYTPESIILKKVFPPDRVPPAFYGQCYGIITSIATIRKLKIQEVDIRDMYKNLGLPLTREALHKRYGKKTVIFPNLQEKAMDSSLTRADKFTLVEAIALLEM